MDGRLRHMRVNKSRAKAIIYRRRKDPTFCALDSLSCWTVVASKNLPSNPERGLLERCEVVVFGFDTLRIRTTCVERRTHRSGRIRASGNQLSVLTRTLNLFKGRTCVQRMRQVSANEKFSSCEHNIDLTEEKTRGENLTSLSTSILIPAVLILASCEVRENPVAPLELHP